MCLVLYVTDWQSNSYIALEEEDTPMQNSSLRTKSAKQFCVLLLSLATASLSASTCLSSHALHSRGSFCLPLASLCFCSQ